MTAFVLKIIALTTMVIDHMGAVFPDIFPDVFRVIGRIAFPIYVYLVAEGCRYTKNMPNYLLRLGVFALISQIPFDLAFHQSLTGPLQISFLQDTNVFYTLFMGALCAYFFRLLRETNIRWLWLAAVVPLVAIMLLANYMVTDYAGMGVAFIFCMYVIPKKNWRLAAMALFCCIEFDVVSLGLLYHFFGIEAFAQYAGIPHWPWTAMLISCLLTVPLVALYNGERGPHFKWAFYWAYPVHLLILALIWLFIVRVDPIFFG